MSDTHSQVIKRARSASLQVEIREGEEELAALACSDVPVALGTWMVGQRVVWRGECSSGGRQASSTASKDNTEETS